MPTAATYDNPQISSRCESHWSSFLRLRSWSFVFVIVSIECAGQGSFANPTQNKSRFCSQPSSEQAQADNPRLPAQLAVAPGRRFALALTFAKPGPFGSRVSCPAIAARGRGAPYAVPVTRQTGPRIDRAFLAGKPATRHRRAGTASVGTASGGMSVSNPGPRWLGSAASSTARIEMSS